MLYCRHLKSFVLLDIIDFQLFSLFREGIDSNKISTFLTRLAIENPDFSNDLLTAVGIFSIFTNYFTLNLKRELSSQDDIQVFENFWKVMLSKPKVEESIFKINELYWVESKQNGLIIFRRDHGFIRTGFEYPELLTISEKLYDI